MNEQTESEAGPNPLNKNGNGNNNEDARGGAGRNLLYGVLALQMDFISRDVLISGMNAGVLDKSLSLGEILLGQKAIKADRHELLSALVREHLKLHDDDPAMNLAAVSSLGPAKDTLLEIADPDVEISLRDLNASHDENANSEATQTYSTRPFDFKFFARMKKDAGRCFRYAGLRIESGSRVQTDSRASCR